MPFTFLAELRYTFVSHGIRCLLSDIIFGQHQTLRFIQAHLFLILNRAHAGNFCKIDELNQIAVSTPMMGDRYGADQAALFGK